MSDDVIAPELNRMTCTRSHDDDIHFTVNVTHTHTHKKRAFIFAFGSGCVTIMLMMVQFFDVFFVCPSNREYIDSMRLRTINLANGKYTNSSASRIEISALFRRSFT